MRLYFMPIFVYLSFLSFLGCAVSQTSPTGHKEPDSSWAGHRIVMLKGFGDYYVLGANGQPQLINPGALGVNIVAVVQRVDNNNVWIKSNGAGEVGVGWIDKRDVIWLEDAIPYFTSQIKLDPNNWDALLRRAESEHALNKREEAIADYTEAIRLHPEEPFLYLRRGRTLRITRNCEEAAADFQRAIQLAPQWPEPYNLAADVYLETGCTDPHFRDPSKAITYIEHAVALDVKHPTYLTVLASAYAASGQLEKAAITLRQALESPLFPPAYRDGAIYQLHEYEKVLADHKTR